MPIHSALQLLNECRTEGSSALCLESISLKRTNDYLSHLWLFCPRIMKMVEGIMFANLIGPTSQGVSVQSLPLPKLRNIALYGVHLNWTNFLHYTLGAPPNQSLTVSSSMQSLELSYHSGEVRPMPDEFSGIFEACPCLQNLVLRFSGLLTGLSCPISLLLLQRLHYGYFFLGDDIRLFSGLHAPNLIKFSLEGRNLSGTTHSPIEDDGEDDKADSLLKYCVAHHLFPKLQELSLYNVNAPVATFTLLMDAIPTLLHLLLHRTPNAILALSPIQKSLADHSMPFPVLKSIRIFPNSHKDSLIATLKRCSKSAPDLLSGNVKRLWKVE
ncbi:uncharacterized protein EDB93DRAFT_1249763 [Suillus bovinus]|uniref:uncharacterized protein n=1 Tax=Suillus bovinus TaxID=48563 RepID=UPI001B876000|nr:uncharacterized protein EDB93DRAFT_1249763 [Suillus bovinus]KAG2150753.1 hypothetical protein EDB93DRAFT_1249763 [Suillus bovinus]